MKKFSETTVYYTVGKADQLSDGERLLIDVDDNPIVIFFNNGEYFAIADMCSHDNGTLGEGDLDKNEIICPRHGARFDIRTGKVLSLPAIVDIPSYPVRIIDGQIQVGLPKE